ncbi:MAG: hypothetical protein ACOX17_01310 [Christensenellales bacterium]|jgi:hypothetical protein
MKRIVAMALCLLLLAGCGQNGAPAGDPAVEEPGETSLPEEPKGISLPADMTDCPMEDMEWLMPLSAFYELPYFDTYEGSETQKENGRVEIILRGYDALGGNEWVNLGFESLASSTGYIEGDPLLVSIQIVEPEGEDLLQALREQYGGDEAERWTTEETVGGTLTEEKIAYLKSFIPSWEDFNDSALFTITYKKYGGEEEGNSQGILTFSAFGQYLTACAETET